MGASDPPSPAAISPVSRCPANSADRSDHGSVGLILGERLLDRWRLLRTHPVHQVDVMLYDGANELRSGKVRVEARPTRTVHFGCQITTA